jgi:hypothetical protein
MVNVGRLNVLLSAPREGVKMAAQRSHRYASIEFPDGHILF